ncbi:hypothetical protein CCP4SC76_440003 [Gammaproteobacteria bacterium]
MSDGMVPGTGDKDTIPRLLDAGSFVIRKDAVRRYGNDTLDRLAKSVARFAVGGGVWGGAYPAPKLTDPGLDPATPTPSPDNPSNPDPKKPDVHKLNKDIMRTIEVIKDGRTARIQFLDDMAIYAPGFSESVEPAKRDIQQKATEAINRLAYSSSFKTISGSSSRFAGIPH